MHPSCHVYIYVRYVCVCACIFVCVDIYMFIPCNQSPHAETRTDCVWQWCGEPTPCLLLCSCLDLPILVIPLLRSRPLSYRVCALPRCSSPPRLLSFILSVCAVLIFAFPIEGGGFLAGGAFLGIEGVLIVGISEEGRGVMCTVIFGMSTCKCVFVYVYTCIHIHKLFILCNQSPRAETRTEYAWRCGEPTRRARALPRLANTCNPSIALPSAAIQSLCALASCCSPPRFLSCVPSLCAALIAASMYAPSRSLSAD